MNKKEREHLSQIASIGCIVCLNNGYPDTPAEIHHIGNGTLSKRASNFEAIPLCPAHHRTGGHGVAVHAGRKTWESNYGTERELLSQAHDMIGYSSTGG